MAIKKKLRPTFTFNIDPDFVEVFERFKSIASVNERSAGALIRVMIKRYVDEQDQVSEKR